VGISIVKQLTASLLVVAACALVACGGGGSSKQASQTQTGQATQTSADTRPGGAGSSGSGGTAGSHAGGTDNSARGAGAPKSGSGGAAAPRVTVPVRKRTLLHYLTVHYRQQVWYPLLTRLRIRGNHVRVYLNFPPSSDDENPPLLACKAVLSYGGPVKEVTVYGNPNPQGQLLVMKHCQGSLPPPGAGVLGR
jgi:hypothetical protein